MVVVLVVVVEVAVVLVLALLLRRVVRRKVDEVQVHEVHLQLLQRSSQELLHPVFPGALARKLRCGERRVYRPQAT